MINLIDKKQWFFLGSAIALVISILALAIFGIRPGIDFTGGTAMTLRLTPQVNQEELRSEMSLLGYDTAIIQSSGQDYLIRMREISPEEREELTTALSEALDSEIVVRDYNAISPSIATETARSASIAVMIASLAMLFYIAWAFRRMPSPFRWGLCAIIALIHNVMLVAGIFSILGKAVNIEIDALFITGILTIVGYSINNTVVVFDRIRENMTKGISNDFAVIVNSSLLETMGRSLNTSITTICVILALLLFGGATIHNFMLVLLIGLLAGTYSSLLIAGPLLVVWEKKEWGQLFSKQSFKARSVA
jgi:preprotein translocase subunit SecF